MTLLLLIFKINYIHTDNVTSTHLALYKMKMVMVTLKYIKNTGLSSIYHPLPWIVILWHPTLSKVHLPPELFTKMYKFSPAICTVMCCMDIYLELPTVLSLPIIIGHVFSTNVYTPIPLINQVWCNKIIVKHIHILKTILIFTTSMG